MEKIMDEGFATFRMNELEQMEVLPSPKFGWRQALVIQPEYLLITLVRKICFSQFRYRFFSDESFHADPVNAVLRFLRKNVATKLTLHGVPMPPQVNRIIKGLTYFKHMAPWRSPKSLTAPKGATMTQFLCFEDLPIPAEKREEVRCFTQSFQIKKGADGCDKCLLVCAACRFEGTAPHISFQMSFPERETPLYLSHSYPIGGKNFLQQSWRVPPMRTNEITLSICVEIPYGTVLEIRDFSVLYEESTPRASQLPPRYNAHLGLVGMAPGNTMPAFELAALCGFHTCIAVPKITRDGKLVCLHDETINSAARHPDGSELQEKIYVNSLTYNELLQYDFGIRKGTLYRGTKIPLLEEFFALCAQTGMKPMFSTHPNLPPEKWREVRKLLVRYGLLRHFHVKAPSNETIADAVAVFGNEIDGYTLDVQRLEDDSIEKMRKACKGAEDCRIGIEIRHRNCTAEAVRQVLDAEMFAAVWNLPHCNFEEYDRLLSLGVSEFTEDHHCPMMPDLIPMAEQGEFYVT